MRVTTGRSDRANDGERGATLVFVAIALVVLCGAAALTIDIGNGWVTRRNLVTATDAAALAAAQEYAVGGNGCASTANSYVLSNNPSATGISCTPGGSPAAGWVTVYAEDNVNTWFAAALGRGDYMSNSASTAQWGGAASVEGLIPIALCAQVPEIGAWFANPAGSYGPVAVPYSNDGQPDICNNGSNVPGNWGLIDFDGVSGNDSKDWVETGYPGEVWAGTPGNDCPDRVNGNSTCYPPQTGELTQVRQQLTSRIGDVVQMPVIDYAADAGGSNSEFHVIGFANVTIHGLQLTGPDSERYIEIEFLSVLAPGSCCSNSGGPSNISVISQCAVDNRNVGACTP